MFKRFQRPQIKAAFSLYIKNSAYFGTLTEVGVESLGFFARAPQTWRASRRRSCVGLIDIAESELWVLFAVLTLSIEHCALFLFAVGNSRKSGE